MKQVYIETTKWCFACVGSLARLGYKCGQARNIESDWMQNGSKTKSAYKISHTSICRWGSPIMVESGSRVEGRRIAMVKLNRVGENWLRVTTEIPASVAGTTGVELATIKGFELRFPRTQILCSTANMWATIL